MVSVTVSVPVPFPFKVLNPAAFDGVGSVTPNAGGRIVVEKANMYRPFSVARVHRRGPSSFDAARLPDRLTPAIATRPAAKATRIVRRKRRGPVLGQVLWALVS